MKNVKIKVDVVFDNTNESFETVADWDDFKVTFSNATTYYEFTKKGETVHFVKQSDTYLDFTFQKGLSQGMYQMEGHTIPFDIKSHQLQFNQNLIEIHYELMQGHEIISSHSITIKRIT